MSKTRASLKTPTALLLLGATLLAGGSASAFTVRRTADGLPVHWEDDAITVVADPSLAALDPGAPEAFARALATWAAVPGTSLPHVTVVQGLADEVGFRVGDDNNRCTLRWVREGFAPARSALAITVVTFDPRGRILDADIVINGGGERGFAVLKESGDDGDDGDTKGGPYDLQDVLTHEVGHFFGLAHNPDDPDATMFGATSRGETKKRDLTLDDEQGIQSLYPPGGSPPGDSPPAGSPSCAATGGARGGPAWPGALLVAGLVAASRARDRRGRDRAVVVDARGDVEITVNT